MMEGRYKQVGDFVFDFASLCLWKAGKAIELGAHEGKLLEFLVRNQGSNYKNTGIQDFIWPNSTERDMKVSARLHTHVSNLRSVIEPYANPDEYITRNKNPIRLIKVPRAKHPWYRPDLPDEWPRLTPRDPEDEPSAEQIWAKETSTHHNRALHDLEWAWITPFPAPLRIRDFSLTYHEDDSGYETLMPPLARKALQWWRKGQIRIGKADRVARLEAEPLGLQVRLVGMRFAHELGQRHHIDLAPAKFMHYVAVQQNLWHADLHDLRQHVFENAMYGLNAELPLMLPSTFAIHMAAISSDQKALLRQRDKTPLYPLAWEAGAGELMHGPHYAKADFVHHGEAGEDFRHFNDHGEPDLSWYLRNTVSEELSYKSAKDDDFLIYGMAVEWRTLAPKLIVVYQSDAPISVLVEGAKRSPERPRSVSSIDLSVDGVTKSFTDWQYPTWGPTSKLALLLALMQKNEDLIHEVQARLDELDPGTTR